MESMRIAFKRWTKEKTTFSVNGKNLSVITEGYSRGNWNRLKLGQVKRLYEFLGKAIKELEERHANDPE